MVGSGLISKAKARIAVNALADKPLECILSHFDLEESFWAKSCFSRMDVVCQQVTTGKIDTSREVCKKIEMVYIHSIVLKSI